MAKIEDAILVLLRDPNDGYDEIYAFESSDDAQILYNENVNYYSAGYYHAVAPSLSQYLTLAELKDRPDLVPTHIFPKGCLKALSEALDEDEEGGDDLLDDWLNENRHNAVDAEDFSWGNNDDEDEED